MLIHIQHAVQKELAPDRLMFRFEAQALDNLGVLARWFRRGKTKEEAAATVEIQEGDRLFFQLPPAAGPLSLRLPAAKGSACDIVLSTMASLDRRGQSSLKMTPRLSAGGAHIIYTELWVGERRLLYIAPESLLSRTFRKDLNRILKGSPPGSLIVDEAHAVSEWSGNIHPAYQRIPRMIEDLRRHHPGLSVAAVTAWAGKWIARDIGALLDLADHSPPVRKDRYRERVSHQVVVVQSPEAKEAAYEQLLWRDMPALMNREELPDHAAAVFPQYRDPYESILKSAADAGAVRPVLSITERRFTDTGSPHILIRTGMGDSAFDWLCKTAEAGKDGRRVHCIRLADLPSDACEADLDLRRTRIPSCSDRNCPFDRDALCDYGKQHHVIQESHPDIREAFTDVCRMLDLLLNRHGGKRIAQVAVSVPDCDEGRMEKALYRLVLLGVIDTFSIDHRKTPPVFLVYGFKPDISSRSVLLRVSQYLKNHDLSHPFHTTDIPPSEKSSGARFGSSSVRKDRPETPAVANEAPDIGIDVGIDVGIEVGNDVGNDGENGCGFNGAVWLREAHAAEPFLAFDRHRPLFELLAAALPPMLHHVSENLKIMAYRRVWNLKAYMRTASCRYGGLLRSTGAVDVSWQCRACDRCRPDLAFDFSSSFQTEPPEVSEALAETVSARRESVGGPSVRSGDTDVTDGPCDLTILAARLLEEDPRNRGALDLLVQCSAGGEEKRHEKDAMDIAAGDRRLAEVIRLCETDPCKLTGEGDGSAKPFAGPMNRASKQTP